MPRYQIQSPTGEKYEITAPEGASQDEVLAYAQSQFGEKKQPEPSYSDVAISGLNKGIAGLVDAIPNTPANLLNIGKAAVGSGLIATGNQDVAEKYGFTSLTQPPSPTEKIMHRLGVGQVKPVTEGQKALDYAMQALPATALTPGGGLANIAKNAITNMASGVAGGEVYDKTKSPLLSAGASMLVPFAAQAVGQKLGKIGEQQAIDNSQKKAAYDSAKQQGYTVPPSTTNPSLINTLLEGYAGKLKTGQLASQKNQAVTNESIRKALDLPEGAPLNNDTLAAIRKEAGKNYEAVKGTGQITADQVYVKSLDDLAAKYEGAGKDFPALANQEVTELMKSMKVGSFGADSAVDAISILRDKADRAFASGDKGYAKAAKGAANALESLVERHVQNIGDPTLLDKFRTARQTIAKTYSVQKALNSETGNVSAPNLAAQAKRGSPLSGEIKKVAGFGAAFPKAAQDIKDSMPALSPLDYFGAGSVAAGTGNPLPLTHLLARPAIREMILSKPYQAAMGSPNTGELNKIIARLLMTQNATPMSRINPAVANTLLNSGGQ